MLRNFLPPVLLRAARRARAGLTGTRVLRPQAGEQDLDVYWDPVMAGLLETWGEGNAWNEIQLLAAGLSGKVLDIACGTGKTIELLGKFPSIEVHGCDISNMLLDKAATRGIPSDRLQIEDATAMTYAAGSFDYGYSIGSLEHFTAEGIDKFLAECSRVVRGPTFHMIPVSRSGQDMGWIKTFQSYHNNSTRWWEERCRAAYFSVAVLDSSWSDEHSVGKWLICSK